MKRQDRKNVKNLVRFSIGFKLVTIITILVLVSLGAITILVSVMVSADLRITAEDNNFTVNRRSAAEAETSLQTLRSSTLSLLETISLTGTALADQTADIFFDRRQDMAAIVVSSGNSQTARFYMNTRFFVSREIDAFLLESFIAGRQQEMALAASGDALLLNGAPHFGIPVLALFIPWMGQPVAILFSAESLGETFGTGLNSSYLINNQGDILVHADYDLVRAGANVTNQRFIRSIWENPEKQAQTLYSGDDGTQYFGAFTKLDSSGAVVITTIEYNKVFEGIVATTRRNAYLTAAVLFLSVLFIWFFAKSISSPLRQLAAAARRIEEGNFEVTMRLKRRDEIGLLTTSFQRMGDALGIFGKFTNREIAVQAMRGEIKPGGLPKHATIFFSDIRGFTEKSENFTKVYGAEASNRIVHWLNEYFTHMVECVDKTNGVIDKFIGDAVMAHWGTAYTAGSPAADALSCVKAALMMRDALYKLNQSRSAGDSGNPPIRIGCGINTGIVTAGQIGSEARMEYTVIGDPVNLASRIEGLNKPLGMDILITEDTWNLVGEQLITEEMPPVKVKGKEKPIRMFAVVNFKDAPGPRTLTQVRDLLGIEAPDISKMDTGAEEKKYKIVSE